MFELKDDYTYKRKKLSQEELDDLVRKGEIDLSDIHNLDLSNLNLSAYRINEESVYIDNCNLENTNLTINIGNYMTVMDSNLKGVKLRDNCSYYYYFYNVILDDASIEFINKQKNIDIKYDLYTLFNNKGLKIPPLSHLFGMLHEFGESNGILSNIYDEKELKELDKLINKFLKLNKTLEIFYKNVENQLNYRQKILFLFYDELLTKDITLENIVIDDEMQKLIESILDRVHHEIEINYKNVIYLKKDLLSTTYTLKNEQITYHITLPNINPSDYDQITDKRILSSPITFRKNLYVELGRSCNAKCKFCRNSCMNDSIYDYKKIKQNLGRIIDDVDSVIIGGGEPTLRKNDLISLLSDYSNYLNKIYIFTNGTNFEKFYDSILYEYGANLKYYISRHSYGDKSNASIFGLNPNDIDVNLLENYPRHNLTLACTCIKGGIDSLDKMLKYINKYMHYDILFCNLMSDASVNKDAINNDLNVDDNLFDEFISLLSKHGFTYNFPIISTGGYELYILKNGFHNIMLKKYISKKELEEKWKTAIKRTFDLSIAPDGTIYDSWSETEKVDNSKIKKLL